MRKELVKLANHLDQLGHRDLSDRLDAVLTKLAAAGDEEELGETTFISVNLPYPESDAHEVYDNNPRLMPYAALDEVMQASGNNIKSIQSGEKRLSMLEEYMGWLEANGHADKVPSGYLEHMEQQFKSDPQAWGVKFEAPAARRAPSMSDLSGGLITDTDTGNEFRQWANENHDAKARFDLDPSGNWNNSYMRRAWAELGDEYRAYKAGETSGTQPAPAEKEWEEGETHRPNEGAGVQELNLSDPEVQATTVRIVERLEQAVRNEGKAFWGERRQQRIQAWAVRKLLAQHDGMTQLQAAQTVDEMLNEIRSTMPENNADDSYAMDDSYVLDTEASSREERMKKAASLLSKEFSFSNQGLVRR